MGIKIKKDWEIVIDSITSSIKDQVNTMSYVYNTEDDIEMVSDVYSDREKELIYNAKIEVYSRLETTIATIENIMRAKERW